MTWAGKGEENLNVEPKRLDGEVKGKERADGDEERKERERKKERERGNKWGICRFSYLRCTVPRRHERMPNSPYLVWLRFPFSFFFTTRFKKGIFSA